MLLGLACRQHGQISSVSTVEGLFHQDDVSCVCSGYSLHIRLGITVRVYEFDCLSYSLLGIAVP